MTLWIVVAAWVIGIPIAAYVIGYAEGRGWMSLGDDEGTVAAMVWPMSILFAACIVIGVAVGAVADHAIRAGRGGHRDG
jgi:formate hydrogenlyase subunit 3/multisubunit Na+/H+ antiporter MnhD subunit